MAGAALGEPHSAPLHLVGRVCGAAALLILGVLVKAALRRRRRPAPGAAKPAPVRIDFPAGFLWGSASAAYQIEGGAGDGGRGPSIWDDFSRAGKCHRRETGDVACDHFQHWKEDVALMKSLGLKAYRLSISWSRVLPEGAGCLPNEEGILFYRGLLQELVSAGIEPMVTLYHWDLPSALEARGGWLSAESVEWFEAYARLCYSRFGDLVRLWCTLNEPTMQCLVGYSIGAHAPGHREKPGEEPYLVAHHMLLAHARAYRLYHNEFNPSGRGEVGLAINTEWFFPADPSDKKQCEQCERAVDFSYGWIAEPLRTGDYPPAMREAARERLPEFSEADRAALVGSYDWLGVNHYTSRVLGPGRYGLRGLLRDLWVLYKSDGGLLGSVRIGCEVLLRKSHVLRDAGICPGMRLDWELTDMGWPIAPEGMEAVLKHVSARYQPRGGVYITENGVAFGDQTLKEAMSDGGRRTEFLRSYIGAVGRAIQAGADVRGYLMWTFMDNFEWAHGTSKRFGLVHVDFEDPSRARTPKPCAAWYSNVIEENAVVV